ncbi:MAG: hypothetical protein AAF366_03420 [Pseudomonadota bacterium]
MASDLQLAISKIGSIKISTINAIGDLGIRAEAARRAGNDKLSSDLQLKAVELAKKVAKLREAEKAARRKEGLGKYIEQLDRVAKDARRSQTKLERTEEILKEVETFIRIIVRVAKILL